MTTFPELFDLTEICRSCMTKKLRMRPLFGSSLDSMLMAVANVEVAENDGYPAQMCVQCVLQVSRAFTFKQQCEKTDATLKIYLSRLAIEQVPKTESEVIVLDDDTKHEALQFITLELENSDIEYQFNDNATNECLLILRNVDNAQQESVVLDGGSSSFVMSTDGPLQEAIIQADDTCPDVYLPADSSVEREDQAITVPPFDLDQHVLELNGEVIDDDRYDAEDPDVQTDDYPNIESDSLVTGKAILISDVFRCHNCHNALKSDAELKEHTISCRTLTIFPKRDSPELNPIITVKHPPPSYDLSVSDRFECVVCNKNFSDSSKLRRHSRTHLIDKPHVCKICGMSFAESSNLTKHNRKHTGELRNVVGKPNLCSVCGKRFKWATSLSKHMKHHTKRKLFVCPYKDCNKYYVEQRSLDIHLYSHDGQKPFACSFCNKGFTQKCNLEKHERVHTGEKPFKCNVCHKSFAQSGYLVIHQRIHSHEKPYNCEECGKQFAASNALTVHLRSHSGERPYGCDICSKRFSRQETLTIHRSRKHTNERLHTCMLCPAKFLATENLTAHMKSNHGDRYYHLCPTCGRVFASVQSLKNHQKIHFKEGEMGGDNPQPMIQFVVNQEIVD